MSQAFTGPDGEFHLVIDGFCPYCEVNKGCYENKQTGTYPNIRGPAHPQLKAGARPVMFDFLTMTTPKRKDG